MRRLLVTIFLTTLFILPGMITTAGETKDDYDSFFANEQLKLKYNLVDKLHGNSELFAAADEAPDVFSTEKNQSIVKKKSPAKAFGLSLLLPGAGQYYNGSRVKPFIFLGVEVASWVMYFKWHNEGDDITAEFEAFNRAHWSENSYRDFLEWTYGERDEDLIGMEFPEVSHHLPTTTTQQYYEMTGKYDQFSWGWDDAVLNNNSLGDYSIGNPPPRVFDASGVPSSTNRDFYETRRDDANDSFSRASTMIFISIANRVVSAFEAMIQSKKFNKKLNHGYDDSNDSQINFDFSLKSKNELFDTPQFVINYRF